MNGSLSAHLENMLFPFMNIEFLFSGLELEL
jgi:hypothetical protein